MAHTSCLVVRVKPYVSPLKTRFIAYPFFHDRVSRFDRRDYHSTPTLSRIIKPRYPDFSPKIIPELLVQDTIDGLGEPKSLANDPDAPTFDMEDPYVEAPPKCVICENQIPIDYKNIKLLSQFVSTFTGTIYPRKVVGLCTIQYDKIVEAIIFCRRMAMMSHKFKSQSFYDDDRLMYPRPDKVIRKRLADAAAEYKRQNPSKIAEEDEEENREKEQISIQ